MTILVTGGAGYIGSHTVRMLRARGRDVVVLDTLELGHRDALLGAELVVGDIRDRALVTELCRSRSVTQVVHFAAYKNVGESMVLPDKYWLNNVAGTVDLVEAMLAAEVRSIVFSSSCSVNGTPPAVPVTEDAPIAPESVYAESKATVERILRWYGVTHGLTAVNLRYFNAAGASDDSAIGEDWTQSLNLIPLVMKAILGKRGSVRVFGDDYPTPDGTCVRDYVHVDDLADAHLRILALLQPGEALKFNLGSGQGASVLDIIHACRRITGHAVPVQIGPRRPGDPPILVADSHRARSVLGWQPVRSGVDAIVASAWRWHQGHPLGYADRTA